MTKTIDSSEPASQRTSRRSFLGLLASGAAAAVAAPTLLRAESAAPTPAAPAGAPTGIIDLHTHWFSERSAEFLAARTAYPRFVKSDQGEWSVERSSAPAAGPHFPIGKQWFDLDLRLRHLDQFGVRRQLLSWPTTLNVEPSLTAEEAKVLWGDYNTDLSAAVAKHADRLSGVTVLSTLDLDWSARELERGHDKLGLIGAVLPANGFATAEGAKRFAPLFEVAQRHKSHIYLHTGYAHASVPGQPAVIPHGDSLPARNSLDNAWQFAAATITLAYSGFLDQYPDVTVQIAQLGGSGAIALVAEQVRLSAGRLGIKDPSAGFRNIYLDTGAAGNGPEAVALAAKVFGADQIVFGTDFAPQPSVEPIIKHVLASHLPAEQRQRIFVENGQRILAAHGVT